MNISYSSSYFLNYYIHSLLSEFIWTIPLVHATIKELKNRESKDNDPNFVIDWIYRKKESKYLTIMRINGRS